jgi:hypothetical protein
MPKQDESGAGVPRKPRAGAEQKRQRPERTDGSERQPYRSDGPGKVGLTSDNQPDLVAPSGVNERDHGAADDKPMGGGSVNLDDDDLTHPRGKTTAAGGTWQATGGDSAPLGPPKEILSGRNGPSDPAKRKK